MVKLEPVYFYEHEFYVLSNFSSFRVLWKDIDFMTSEHAYHYEKFVGVPDAMDIQHQIYMARSAHDSLKIAHAHKPLYREDWERVKLSTMREVLRAKVHQHPYVMKKLLQTGDRPLVEDSHRDGFWGWGLRGDGHNHLGRLWMEIRDELKRAGK
jgi:ribA/ribD-fused uncharacterized protein